jgi:hypothetical protein
MANETNTFVVSRPVEEDKDIRDIVQDVLVTENCSAKCPTCQQSCDYTAGHGGLHHCDKGHEWI